MECIQKSKKAKYSHIPKWNKILSWNQENDKNMRHKAHLFLHHATKKQTNIYNTEASYPAVIFQFSLTKSFKIHLAPMLVMGEDVIWMSNDVNIFNGYYSHVKWLN